MNEDEAGTLIGESFEPANPTPFLDECGRALAASQPRIQIIVSAGKQGAYAYSAGIWLHRRALEVRVVSTAGAGDALLAGVLAGVAVGMPLVKADSTLVAPGLGNPESAFDWGVLLATYSVTSPHTIHPDANLETISGFARDLANSP
jgi:sugar/nucleoside kinase (ribokinase family)